MGVREVSKKDELEVRIATLEAELESERRITKSLTASLRLAMDPRKTDPARVEELMRETLDESGIIDLGNGEVVLTAALDWDRLPWSEGGER